MDDFLKQIAAVFSLTEDATEQQVLAAAHAALANQIPADHIAVTAARVTELERAARVPAGHVVIAAQVLEETEQRAAGADRLRDELADIKFETAFSAALSEGKVIPTEKDSLRAVFKQNADLALDMLRERLPVVITAARGDNGYVPGDAPEGSDPESYALHRKVEAYMRDKGMTPAQYTQALEVVMAQEGI
jgi:phage I-like protein